MESVWIFKLGLVFLMKSISNTNQSNLPWHFLKTVNWFSYKRLLLPWASKKCLLIFVLSNALMKVSGCVPDIICIVQITWKVVNNTMLIHNWRLNFFGFKSLPQFLAHENWLQSRANLMAKIAQLLPSRISGHLIFKWKTNSYCATLIIVSFCFFRWSISKKKIVDSRINKTHWIVKATKYWAQLGTFCIESLCCRRQSIGTTYHCL